MDTIRESFLQAINRRRQYLDLVTERKIRSFEIDEHGKKTDVTDQMVSDARAVIAMYEQELKYLGGLEG